ncbi:MAG: cytochrome c oxidase accessory protein CcoG [Spirochaetales bacterium]|nr:cytochrome c oxidase accessory protein CcoG [Spirochaetales bacterium]
MVIPRPISGTYRNRKNIASVVLLAILFGLPFVRIAGDPLILLDIPARKFHIFGLTIWPQELHLLHMLLIIAGLSLFFFTALFGRLWCGYACPQTIFTELYDHVGRLFGGSSYGKKAAGRRVWWKVYPAWIILSFLLSFIYLSYFRPFEELAHDLAMFNVFLDGAPAPWAIAFLSLTTFSFVNAAYFRENVCKYVCPYGRFQTALLDQHSPIVSYTLRRGEPRREAHQKVGDHAGDCISCNLCVVVCPTGIDIREGLQVGCLACGLCADACTQVMAKFKKETLIDYRTIKQVDEPTAAVPYIRPRTLIYATLLLVFSTVFGVVLYNRSILHTTVLRDRQLQSLFIADIGYQNGYELHAVNKSKEPLTISVRAADGFELIQPEESYTVAAGELQKIRVIARKRERPPGRFAEPIEFKVQGPDGIQINKSVFSYPEK